MSITNPPKAILFDTFGSVVDWRSSLIDDLSDYGARRGIDADWVTLVDDWRAAYFPSMERVHSGELGWTTLDELHRMSLEGLVNDLGIVGLNDDDLDYVTMGWHRLRPWPDAVPGLTRLKEKFIIGPLSNGGVRLLVDVAKFGGLPWDMVFGSDVFRHYKPDPETYLGACEFLDLEPSEVMMAAAHNRDLTNARSFGLQTAFFARPTEYGPRQQINYSASSDWEVVANDIEDLATQLGV